MIQKLEILKSKKEELLRKSKAFHQTLKQLNSYDLLFDELTTFLNRQYLSKNNIELLTLSMIEGMILNHLNNNQKYSFTILYGDIDGLKMINDLFNHHRGNVEIRKIANIIKKVIRMNRKTIIDQIIINHQITEKLAIRIGGDEFLIILPYCTKEQAHQTVVKRIKNQLSQTIKQPAFLSLSIGVSDTNEMSIPKELGIKELDAFFHSIVKKAEARMYEEKKETYRQNIPFLVLKTLTRLSDNLDLDFKKDTHFEQLIEILKDTRNKMIK